MTSESWNAIQFVSVGAAPVTLPSPVVGPRGLIRLSTGHAVGAVVEDMLGFSSLGTLAEPGRIGAITETGVVLFESGLPGRIETGQSLAVGPSPAVPVVVSVREATLRVDPVDRAGVSADGFAVSGPHAAGLLWAAGGPELFVVPKSGGTLEQHRLSGVAVGGGFQRASGVASAVAHPLAEAVVGLDTVPFTDPAHPEVRCLVGLRFASTPDTLRLYRVLSGPPSMELLTVVDPPAGESFAAVVSVGGEFVVLGGAGGRIGSWRRFSQPSPGRTPVEVGSGTLPALRPRSAHPNLFRFDRDPFLAANAVFQGSGARPDWTGVGPAGAWAETDGGEITGLGSPQALPADPLPGVVLGNQLLPQASVAGFGAVSAVPRGVVQFGPPPGIYGTLPAGQRFGVTLSSAAVGEVLRYRLGDGSGWRTYETDRPVSLEGDGEIQAYAEDPFTGARSAVATGRYTFRELPIPGATPFVDADADGLGDDWERAMGIGDPNSDTDRDGANALAEYVGGTDPWDPNSRPAGGPGPVAEIQRAVVQDGRIQLSWPAELRGYTLESSTDMRVWTPVVPQPQDNRWSEAVEGVGRFFRLRGL
jgi:hypothetical protein